MLRENRTQPPDLVIGINLLRNDQKFYRLPLLRQDNSHLQDGDTVELVLLDVNQFSIKSYDIPMRYGKYYNNRVFFNVITDQFNINPKFVFDGKKQVWALMNAGYVCFSELELEYKSNYKIYGEEDA